MCKECDERPYLKVFLGHDGPPANWLRENLLTGEPLAECPMRTILRRMEEHPDLSREVFKTLDEDQPAYEKGILLVKGGRSDQPARWLELVTMVGRVRASTEAKEMDLREKNAKPDEGDR